MQDERDHEALIDTLVNEIVPLYYDRDATGLPRGWIARQKNALRSLAWRFNADRMVMDYVMNCYLPAANGLSCDDDRAVREGEGRTPLLPLRGVRQAMDRRVGRGWKHSIFATIARRSGKRGRNLLAPSPIPTRSDTRSCVGHGG